MRKKITSIVLSAAIAAAAFAAPGFTASAATTGTITLSGSTSVAPLAQELASEFKKSNPGVTINFTNITGSGSGISDAMDGKVDIGMSSRALKDSELEVLKSNVICNDGVAIVVNKANPTNNISAQQLYNLYSKETTNWSAISSFNQAVAAYSRESGSGTRSCFEDVLKNDYKLDIANNYGNMDGIIPNTGAMQTSVKGNAGGIGYMSLGDMDETQVKALKFEGVEANVYNVANGSYKMSRPFVMATKGEATGAAKAFIDWCKTNATAQNIVSEMGFVKLGLMKIQPTAMHLNKSAVSLKPGQSFKLNASFTPSNANMTKVSYSSSKSSVAAVSGSGVITAKSVGTAVITVKTTQSDKTLVKTCKVTVAYPVTGVKFSKSVYEVKKGKTVKTSWKITPANATNKKVTFKSMNTKIAAVNSKGVVKGVNAGVAKIKITTVDGKKTAYCSVKVVIPVKSVSLNKSSVTIRKGGVYRLIANIKPANATNKNVIWTSKSKKTALVTELGWVVALKKGSTTVQVKTVDGGKTKTCKIIVK